MTDDQEVLVEQAKQLRTNLYKLKESVKAIEADFKAAMEEDLSAFETFKDDLEERLDSFESQIDDVTAKLSVDKLLDAVSTRLGAAIENIQERLDEGLKSATDTLESNMESRIDGLRTALTDCMDQRSNEIHDMYDKAITARKDRVHIFQERFKETADRFKGYKEFLDDGGQHFDQLRQNLKENMQATGSTVDSVTETLQIARRDIQDLAGL